MRRSALAILAGLILLAAALPAAAGEDARGYLGVTLGAVDDETAADLKLDDARGALILTVLDGTPADEAGLEAGDVILEFDGERVDDPDELTELVRARAPGEEVEIEVRRDRKTKTVTATLAEHEDFPFLVYDADDDHFAFDLDGLHGLLMTDRGGVWHAYDWRGRARLGAEVRDLEEPLADYFPKVERGALVLAVRDGSPAAEAELQPGDVIVELDGRTVSDADDLHHAVRKAAGEKDVEIVTVRQGKRRTAQVDLEDLRPALKRGLRGVPHRLRVQPGEPWHWRAFLDLDEEEMNKDLEETLKRLEKRLEQLEERLDED